MNINGQTEAVTRAMAMCEKYRAPEAEVKRVVARVRMACELAGMIHGGIPEHHIATIVAMTLAR